MADQPIVSVQAGAQPTGSTVLPTQQANSFALAINLNEILVAVGASRLTMNATPTGPTPQHSIEWVVTLSISPTAVLQLIKVLESGLKGYEERFGKIPLDPKFKMTHSG